MIYETKEDAQRGVANRMAELISAADDFFSLGLAGGSTPEVTYEMLRGRATGWTKVVAWLGDERWVPHEGERSNGRMASDALLDHVDAVFHRPPHSSGMTPEDSAAYYEATLRGAHAGRRPDLVILGLGEDGHTASLFPRSEALSERERWYVSNNIPDTGEPRLTATYPLLWLAKRLIVLAAGEGKAEALAATMAGDTPASLLSQGDGEIEWHIDRPASSQL